MQGSLGDALKQGEPAWDTIQPKTQEYAQLASEMGKLEPVKGTKDSWARLTLAFADSACAVLPLDHFRRPRILAVLLPSD